MILAHVLASETDRTDLDDQLFGQFQRWADILGQTPVQASGREHLRELLNRAGGGVVFTTIRKFMPEKGEAMPELSGRQNIVIIADEAHRSQYGFGGKVNEKTGEMTCRTPRSSALLTYSSRSSGLA